MKNISAKETIQLTLDINNVFIKAIENFLSLESNYDPSVDFINMEKSNFDSYISNKTKLLDEEKSKIISVYQSNIDRLNIDKNEFETQMKTKLNKIELDISSYNCLINSEIDSLKKERYTFKGKFENEIKSSEIQEIKRLYKYEKDWSKFNNMVSELEKKWITYKRAFEMLSYITFILGIVLMFFIPWPFGLITSIFGYWLFSSIEESIDNKIKKVNLILLNGNDVQMNGNVIDNKIIDKQKKYKDNLKENEKRISNLQKERNNTLEDFNRKIKKLDEDYYMQLNNFEKRKESEIINYESQLKVNEESRCEKLSKLKFNTLNGIEILKNEITNSLDLLNLLPETFNLNSINWKDESIFKGKEIVTSNLRIGTETISIKIEDVKYTIEIPTIIQFLNKCNLSFNCHKQIEINEAIRISHNIISRLLLSLPAGKIKITFIDPLGLGENAAQFTALKKEITGGMVYTQSSDIENQLLIHTRAIENVIQKYLQGNIESMAKYNELNNEVPEPYRLLVLYNFPHGFNEITTNKLINIIKSGPKAGVHTIMINEKNAKLPFGIDWKVFEEINIEDASPLIQNNTNEHFTIDKLSSETFKEIVDYVNRELSNTSTLKVPFTKYIEKNQNEWWKEKAHKNFSVPIGRHALEIQNLRFDNEDDNQALLIGKPGSGKSNLLHVIIINSLWKYSPDQLEIYLIDFKGGVEFTIYADKKIPHIKTIAIESEREFGLSVLDGVERELLRRESEFSKKGVQNIEQFHDNYPKERMPRVLLIVDEFQEFYSEDDNIKQAVDEKFDRIVRKGRAFGINSLFSSQTLDGHSIKRSTKDLIDIRIALMCSDEDSKRILDDRNPSARDLTRPGEGIYNAENGKTEGNKRFQAFFIERDDLMKTIETIVSFSNTQENGNINFKQIIFRGSEKAHINKDGHPIKKINFSENPKSIRIWLGEPVAIADDVSAVIRKQSASNLLVVGYDENIGLRVMCSSIISIAAHQQPKTCIYYSFNFYNVDSEFESIPAELFNKIDQDCKTVDSKKVKETLESIKEEIEKRLTVDSINYPNIYLCFFSFQRGRVFRKDGYSMSEEGNLFAYIIKEGADVGVFSLVQVDTMDNFSKNLDDKLLKEFSQRVASQMNPDNSVKVIGNQKASKLGTNRALYYDDNENTMIKFKPYELPSFDWVAELNKKQSTFS